MNYEEFTKGREQLQKKLDEAVDLHGIKTMLAHLTIMQARSALESRRVSLGAQWVDSRESSLLRRLERGREIGL